MKFMGVLWFSQSRLMNACDRILLYQSILTEICPPVQDPTLVKDATVIQPIILKSKVGISNLFLHLNYPTIVFLHLFVNRQPTYLTTGAAYRRNQICTSPGETLIKRF